MIGDGRLEAVLGLPCHHSHYFGDLIQPILFIPNTFQISPAQGSPRTRFMNIISYLSYLLGYVISISVLTYETKLLIALIPHICSSPHSHPLSVSCNLYFQLLMSKIMASSLILLLFYSHLIHQKIWLALPGSSNLSSPFLIHPICYCQLCPEVQFYISSSWGNI